MASRGPIVRDSRKLSCIEDSAAADYVRPEQNEYRVFSTGREIDQNVSNQFSVNPAAVSDGVPYRVELAMHRQAEQKVFVLRGKHTKSFAIYLTKS